MKKGRFTKEQIIDVLKQHEAGRKVPELAMDFGVSDATIYTWKSKYGSMESTKHNAQESRGREPAAEAVGGRFEPGQGSAGRCKRTASSVRQQRQAAVESPYGAAAPILSSILSEFTTAYSAGATDAERACGEFQWSAEG